MNYDAGFYVVNSTIFGNQSAIDGGGLENGNGECCGSYTLFLNATVYQNTAAGKGGSVDNENASGDNEIDIVNALFAGGSAPTGAEIANLDIFYSYGGNLIQGSTSGNAIPAPQPSTGPADLIGSDPKLASGLASNGGPTQTIAETTASPGKGYIPFANGYCGDYGPNIDQRNYTRGAGNVCDIGAYEFSGVASMQPASKLRNMSTSSVFRKKTPH